VWAVQSAAAQPTPTPYLGEPPQAASSPEELQFGHNIVNTTQEGILWQWSTALPQSLETTRIGYELISGWLHWLSRERGQLLQGAVTCRTTMF
jgi:hypothetical protein